MRATEAVEDRVDTLTCEAVNLLHEVELLVIDRGAAQVGNGRRPARRAGAVHLEPGEMAQLQECRPDAT